MGYEFRLTELRHTAGAMANESIDISLMGLNNGVAPFYYPWSVEWALLDSTGKVVSINTTDWDTRNWQPGEFSESANVSFDVPPESIVWRSASVTRGRTARRSGSPTSCR